MFALRSNARRHEGDRARAWAAAADRGSARHLPGGTRPYELCDRDGSFIPFSRTRRKRETAGDPHPSIGERYGSHVAYVAKVEAAARGIEATKLPGERRDTPAVTVCPPRGSGEARSKFSVHPDGAGEAIVAIPTHHGGNPVSRKPDGRTLECVADGACANQFRAL